MATLTISGLASVAVTGSAPDDAAVTVECQAGNPALVQVVVVSRTPTGAVGTIGQVVGPILNGHSIRVVDFGGRTDGTILVEVTRVYGTDGRAQLAEVDQWRGYHFDGQNFTQSSGSATFDADTTTTRLTVAPLTLVLGPANSHVTLAVAVTNTGTTAAVDVSLRPIMSSGIRVIPNNDCAATSPGVLCRTPSIAPGSTWTASIDLTVDDPHAVDTVPNANIVQLRLGDQHYSDTSVTIRST